ncbi:MAG: AI-2E family transporter [Bordetella sp.]|nr:MAG: AI-2E family transporter [Bordetella sp.]
MATQPILPSYLIVRSLILLLILSGCYFLRGFLIPGLIALIIGFGSWPIYQSVVNRLSGRTTFAASLALSLVILLLVIPMGLVLSYSIQEAGNFIGWALSANKNGIETPQWISSIPFIGDRLNEYWENYLGKPHALGRIVQMVSGEHLGNIYRMILSATGNIFHLIFAVLSMLIILFFVYKDGASMMYQLDSLGERILPDRWTRLSRMVPATISATINGMSLIALGEGLVLGIAYWIAHVPYPVLLGVVTGLMALIPGGAPLAFSSVSLYLIANGYTVEGISLFMWGSIELLIVDKTLRPKLIGGPVKLPFLPTFFGLIGGIKTMGIIGLFVGPVLMALLVGIWREWMHNARKEQRNIRANARLRRHQY